MFQDCYKLKEIYYYDNIINIDDKEFNTNEEYLEYNNDYNEDIDNTYNYFYKNLRTNNIFSIYSEITQRIKTEESHDNSIISYIEDDILPFQYNYYHEICQVFMNCLSLSSIPDISNCNIDNTISMKEMFYNCRSLSSLPDISKWNTNNVINMEGMFFGCKSLFIFIY